MPPPWKLLAIAAVLAWSAGPAAAQNKPAAGKKPSSTWETKKPMTFYLAKGAMGSCGEGCSEWIAAEGYIGPNSPDRLRELLKKKGIQQLPVVFNSLGGLRSDSIALGRLLRQRGMTAIVGETVPLECDRYALADIKCETLKKSGKTLQADLITADATCSSACGYAFLGGKVRWVPAGAQIGIHLGRTVARRGDKTKALEKPNKAGVAAMQKSLRQYVREMGIDTRFVDAAEKVPHEKIHYLTRDQIIGFRIDTREFQQTPWMYGRPNTGALKFWVEATGTTTKEHPTSLLQLQCGGGNRLFATYYRGLAADTARLPQVELIADGRPVTVKFQGTKHADWIENERMFESYWAFLDYDFAEAARRDGIELKEIAPSGEATRNVMKLSPAGWKPAINSLRCMNLS